MRHITRMQRTHAEFFLNCFKPFPTHQWLVMPLDKVLRPLTAVHTHTTLAATHAYAPVSQVIARIVLVSQQIPQALIRPFQIGLFLVLHCVERLTDVAVAGSLLRHLERQTHAPGLRFVDMPFPISARLDIAVAGFEVRLTISIAPLVSPQYVLADAVALLLCNGREDAEYQLTSFKSQS